LVIEIDDFDLDLVDPKRDPPIFGDEQTPVALPVTRQLMRLPAWNRPKLILPLHVLQEGENAAELGDHGRLQARGIVIFDESTQTLVDHVPDFHEII
jgi:hypothetical protein